MINIKLYSSVNYEKLNRTEGISYLPNSEKFIVANVGNDSLTIYTNNNANTLHVLPKEKYRLAYPHDIDFSIDGKYAAVANRYASEIGIFNFNAIDDSFIFYKAVHSMTAGGVAFSKDPSSKFIAVANTYQNMISLFKYDDNELEPYQRIGMYKVARTPIDGLAISPLDNTLAVASHGNNSILFFRYVGNGIYEDIPYKAFNSKHLYYPHSLTFHPITNDLVISNASGKNTLNIFGYTQDINEPYNDELVQQYFIYNPDTLHKQDEFPEEGGIKGISFSTDGTKLVCCAPDIINPTHKLVAFSVSW